MAFEGLTERLQNAISKLKRKGKISESDVKEVMREIRLALLEADVNFKVVKDFVKEVKNRAVGAEVLESLTPAQQIVKIVNEELIKRGAAWVYEEYIRDKKHLSYLMSLQSNAKKNKKGLWRGTHPVRPSVYRKQKKS